MAKQEENLNDGLLTFGKIQTVRGKNNKIDKSADPFNEMGKLYFNFKTIRQDDAEQYGGKRKVVDLKVKSYYLPDVLKTHKVKIEEELYDINAVDPDTQRKYMYWYLSKAEGGSI